MRAFDSDLLVPLMFVGIPSGLVLLFQFLSLRLRNSALPPDDRDPHLGRKFALGVFLHLSVLVLLFGLTVLATDTFDQLLGGGSPSPTTRPAGGPWGPMPAGPPAPVAKPFPNPQQRVAFGLMLSGVLHGVLFAMLFYFVTNARKFPAVGRAFVLNRLLLAGLLLVFITTTFCLYLFSEGDGDFASLPRLIGLAVVWGPAALAHFLWMMFGLTADKAKAQLKAEVSRPREGEDDRPRRRTAPPTARRSDDD